MNEALNEHRNSAWYKQCKTEQKCINTWTKHWMNIETVRGTSINSAFWAFSFGQFSHQWGYFHFRFQFLLSLVLSPTIHGNFGGCSFRYRNFSGSPSKGALSPRQLSGCILKDNLSCDFRRYWWRLTPLLSCCYIIIIIIIIIITTLSTEVSERSNCRLVPYWREFLGVSGSRTWSDTPFANT